MEERSVPDDLESGGFIARHYAAIVVASFIVVAYLYPSPSDFLEVRIGFWVGATLALVAPSLLLVGIPAAIVRFWKGGWPVWFIVGSWIVTAIAAYLMSSGANY